MKKYFGILNNEKVNDLEVEKLLDFYTKKGLFNISHSYSMDISIIESNDNIVSPQISLKPTQEVINVFYDFFKEIFSRNIDHPYLQYFNDFNENIYGLDKTAQREIALQHFNELYKKIKVLEASFVKREKDDNGVEQIKSLNRFDFLKGRQNGQKQQLATNDNVLEFLHGNETYFKSKQFIDDPNTIKFIEFESSLKILVSLNSQYKFEDDFHFSDLGLLKSLFEKYRDIFKSFEVFVYTHKKIQSFTENKPAHITSLFVALLEMRFIPNSKTKFMNYVNLEHQITLIRLKYYEPKENRKHDARVKEFMADLEKYSTKK